MMTNDVEHPENSTDVSEPGTAGAEPAKNAEKGGSEVPAAAPDLARVDSVSQFIQVAKDWIPDERIRGDVRVTPKGLFLHKDTLGVVMERYQAWLHTVAPHVDEPTPARILKRMFNTAEPPLFYLIEPKRVLVGHLIEAPVANPRQLGLPVYLGSLEDAFTRVHPRDPLIQCIPQLTVTQTPQGVSFELEIEKRKVTFGLELVQLFARLAKYNRGLRDALQGEGPWALREVLRVLIERLGRARWAPENQRLLLPQSSLNDRAGDCLVDGHLFFPVRGHGGIETIVDRDGANLFSFVRAEALALSRPREGRPRESSQGNPQGSRVSPQALNSPSHAATLSGGRGPGDRRYGSDRGGSRRQNNSEQRSGGPRRGEPHSVGHSVVGRGVVGRSVVGHGVKSIDIAGVGVFVPGSSGGMHRHVSRGRNQRGGRSSGAGQRAGGRAPAADVAGQFRFYGKSYSLSMHALGQFVRAVVRSAPEISKSPLPGVAAGSNSGKSSRSASAPQDWRRFSVLDCIRELGEIFVRAEAVDASRVERFVRVDSGRHFGRGSAPGQFRMLERWIFVVGEGDIIEVCADKLLGERDAGRGSDNRRDGAPPRTGDPRGNPRTNQSRRQGPR